MTCQCENCGKDFKTENGEWYDLCDECVGPYEEALAEARAEDDGVLRVEMLNTGKPGFRA